jgi:hypothetical protein
MDQIHFYLHLRLFRQLLRQNHRLLDFPITDYYFDPIHDYVNIDWLMKPKKLHLQFWTHQIWRSSFTFATNNWDLHHEYYYYLINEATLVRDGSMFHILPIHDLKGYQFQSLSQKHSRDYSQYRCSIYYLFQY